MEESMKISLLGVWFALLVTLSSAHATEDPLRDTLWIRQMPLGGQNFSKPLFHPNGKTVFTTSDQYMFEYDVATGNLLKTRETKSQLHINDYVLTSDVQYIIVGTLKENAAKQGMVEVWHIDTGFVKSFTLQKYQYVEKLAVTSDNKTLFVGSAPYGLYRINLESMQVEKENPNFGDQIALSPDGKTLISTVEYFQGGDETVSFLLDSENFKIIGSVPDYLYAPTFKTTGELIGGYTSRGDVPYTYYIGVYDMRDKSFHKLGENRGIQYAGSNIAFTKDNKYIVGTRNLGGYSVWDIATKKPLYEAPYETGGDNFSISDDNKYYCSISPTHIVIWKFKDPSLNSIDETSIYSLSLYPNPTQSVLTIQLPSMQKYTNGYCSISDIQGKKVIHKILTNDDIAQGNYVLDIAHLPNGQYQCRISIGTSEYSSHFLINR